MLRWTKVNENWSSMITNFTITKGNAKVYALPTHVGIRHLRSQNYTTHSCKERNSCEVKGKSSHRRKENREKKSNILNHIHHLERIKHETRIFVPTKNEKLQI